MLTRPIQECADSISFNALCSDHVHCARHLRRSNSPLVDGADVVSSEMAVVGAFVADDDACSAALIFISTWNGCAP